MMGGRSSRRSPRRPLLSENGPLYLTACTGTGCEGVVAFGQGPTAMNYIIMFMNIDLLVYLISYSLAKHSFKEFLLIFLKAALCIPPRLVPHSRSDPLVSPDSEIDHGSSRFRTLPTVPPKLLSWIIFSSDLLKLPSLVTFYSPLFKLPFSSYRSTIPFDVTF